MKSNIYDFKLKEKYTDDDSDLNKISLKEEINSKNNLIDELEKRIKLLESQLEASKDEVILHLP